MSWKAALIPCLVVLALTPGAWLAGARAEERSLSATAHIKAAEESLKRRKYDAAAASFEQAIRIGAREPGVVAGLGEALLLAGQRAEGLAFLRHVADTPDGASDADEAVERARKVLARKDRAGKALRKRLEQFQKVCLRIAEKSVDREPHIAREAIRLGRAAGPHEGRFGRLAWQAGMLDSGQPLFDGTTAKGWRWLQAPRWTIVEGAIHGTAADVWSVCRTSRVLSGNYDLRCEVRILEGGNTLAMIQAAWSDTHENVSFGIMGKRLVLLEGRALPRTADAPRGRSPRGVSWDPDEWQLLELEFRDSGITARLSGTVVGTIPMRPAYRAGAVGLATLGGKAAFRRIEVVSR